MESAVTLLPQPELADDPKRLATADGVGHPVDGLDHPGGRKEVGF